MNKAMCFFSLIGFLFLSSCVTNSMFEKSIEIDAPKEIVFSIITDYENYVNIIPMLHDSVKILSENKTGLNVIWESTGSFKGYKFTSKWTVTDYIENETLEIKDLDGGIGETRLTVKEIKENKTEYTMYLVTKIYKPYEKEFFAIYEKELQIIKEESEKRFKETMEEEGV